MPALSDTFPAISAPYLGGEPMYATFAVGQTIADVMGPDMPANLRVHIGGHEVPRVLWTHVKPRAGVPVNITVDFAGSDNKWVRTIALVIVAVLSFYTGGAVGAAYGAGWGAAAAGAVSIVGTMAVNALIPPAQPSLTPQDGDQFHQLNSLTGTSNQMAPYGVIPAVLGQIRWFPPHAALPYTEISGDDQYLRLMLDLGDGDTDNSDIEIGETPIGTYDDVEWEISKTPTLYTNDIYEAQVSAALNNENDTVQRTTQTQTTEISGDIVFGQGLFGVNAKGNTTYAIAEFALQYRATGSTGAWIPIGDANGLTLTGGLKQYTPATGDARVHVRNSERKTLRCGFRFKVPAGQYDVVIVRGGTIFETGTQANAKIDKATWSVLRSINPQNPSTTGTTKLCIRIKATDQLTGVVQNVSVLSAQKVPLWDVANQVWTAPVASTNPAWVSLWLATRCPAVLRRLADNRIDLDAWATWASEPPAANAVIGKVMDGGKQLMDWMTDIMAAGRARLGMNGSLYAPVRDLPQSVHWNTITPANSQGFAWARSYQDLPHAFRCKFTNPEANWQEDERVVYWDGYDETNATRFAPLDLTIVTDPATVWRLGRYHLAQLYLRPITYRCTMDIEHIACRRGKLVEASLPVIERGQAYGYLKAVDGATVTLDKPVTLETGATYAVRARCADGTQVQQSVTGSNAQSRAVSADNVVFGHGVDGTETQLQLQDGDGRRVTSDIDITDVYQTDWQGRVRLSDQERTNAIYANSTDLSGTHWNTYPPPGHPNTPQAPDFGVGPSPDGVNKLTRCYGTPGFNNAQWANNASLADPQVTPSGAYACMFAFAQGTSTYSGWLMYSSPTSGGTGTEVGFNITWDVDGSPIVTVDRGIYRNFQVTPTHDGCYIVTCCTDLIIDGRQQAWIFQPDKTTAGGNAYFGFVQAVYIGAAGTTVDPIAYIPTTDGPVTVRDYVASATGEITLGQPASKGATYEWSGSGTITDPASELTLANALPGAAEGDLYVFGQAGAMTLPLIVRSIRPLNNDRAELLMVDEAPDVLTADSGTPPPFVSSITGKAWCAPPKPPVVHIYASNSAPNNAGVIDSQANVSNGSPSSGIYRFTTHRGGIGCPAVDMPVRLADGTDKRAGDIRVGDVLATADPVTLEPGTATVRYSVTKAMPCVEVETRNRSLICSASAPLPTRNDGLKLAPNVAGRDIATLEGWHQVTVLRSAGTRNVQHIDIDDGCFWCNGILHHNKRARLRAGDPGLVPPRERTIL